jgi:hypothetical protein
MNGKIPLEKWVHFNSQYGKSIDVSFSTAEPWIARVLSVHLVPPDGEWQSPTAFLHITSMANTTYSLSTYNKSKPMGIILPISCHEGKFECKSYYRGSLQGTDSLTFAILDSNFEEVPLSKLTVTMLIAQENVAFLTF